MPIFTSASVVKPQILRLYVFSKILQIFQNRNIWRHTLFQNVHSIQSNATCSLNCTRLLSMNWFHQDQLADLFIGLGFVNPEDGWIDKSGLDFKPAGQQKANFCSLRGPDFAVSDAAEVKDHYGKTLLLDCVTLCLFHIWSGILFLRCTSSMSVISSTLLQWLWNESRSLLSWTLCWVVVLFIYFF